MLARRKFGIAQGGCTRKHRLTKPRLGHALRLDGLAFKHPIAAGRNCLKRRRTGLAFELPLPRNVDPDRERFLFRVIAGWTMNVPTDYGLHRVGVRDSELDLPKRDADIKEK